MIFALSRGAGHAGLGGDGHQGLSDGLLPALSHVHADPRGGQRGAVVEAAVVLPHVVHHGGCDDLEAVRVAALGQATVVSALLHLQDLRQRDFLREGGGTQITTSKRSYKKQNIILGFSQINKVPKK